MAYRPHPRNPPGRRSPAGDGRLGDGCAWRPAGCRGVGNGNVPVQAALARVGDIFHAATFDQDPAMLQVVEVGPLGVQDGFQVGG